MQKKRRSAFRPESTPATRVNPSAKVLHVLETLQTYEVLSTPHLLAIVGNGKYERRVLAKLTHGNYIGIPNDILLYCAHNNVPYIYELKPRGVELLKQSGRLDPTPHDSDHFKHKYVRGIIRHSFDIAPEFVDGLTLRTQSDILSDPRCTQKDPRIDVPSGTIKPDGPLFGYSLGGQAFAYFIGFEADRGTEQGVLRPGEKKSLTSMVQRYNEFFDGRYFEVLFGLKNAFLPIVTTKPNRVQTFLEIIAAECPRTSSRFLVATVPDFGEHVPKPDAHIVTGDWKRVVSGKVENFNILEALRTAAQKKAA